jgi:hypothetical protein
MMLPWTLFVCLFIGVEMTVREDRRVHAPDIEELFERVRAGPFTIDINADFVK